MPQLQSKAQEFFLTYIIIVIIANLNDQWTQLKI